MALTALLMYTCKYIHYQLPLHPSDLKVIHVYQFRISLVCICGITDRYIIDGINLLHQFGTAQFKTVSILKASPMSFVGV